MIDQDSITATCPVVFHLRMSSLGEGVLVGEGSGRVYDTLLSPRGFDLYRAFPPQWDNLQSALSRALFT